MTQTIERRTFSTSEVRALDESERPSIEGYAAVYNSMSEDMGFREIIMPGAFDRALASPSLDVVFLKNHDDNFVIGRTSNQTLELFSDERGLGFRLFPNMEVSYCRDIYALIKRGDFSACSFAFTLPADRRIGQSWSTEGGIDIRRITDIESLVDCSVVCTPAYRSTVIDVRSLEIYRESLVPKVKFDAVAEKRRLDLMALLNQF
jgi:HK97 family phage prohead protease